MMPVVLITDFLFFVLLSAVVLYFLYAYKRPHLMRPWKKLVQSRAALVSIVIILFYVLVALLDSLHFKPRLAAPGQGPVPAEANYSNEVISVLDLILTPLREQQEKTYSSPFALHAYVKETFIDNGVSVRAYPRLAHGGKHLDGIEQRAGDIQRRIAVGVFYGVLVFVVFIGLPWLVRAYFIKRSFQGLWSKFLSPDSAALRAVVYTIFALILFCSVCYQLGLVYHILGTDKVGEDVFYQAVKSIRTGILIGTLTTLIMLPFALLLGITAGYFLGKVDDIIQYLYTTLNSIPGVLLIAAAILMLQMYMDKHAASFDNLVVRADTRLLFLCIILGITSWTGLCRLLRAETLKTKSMDYILAARALGVYPMRIILRHIVPNVMHIVFITIALDFSGLVLAEAVLSYVNIGVDPTMHSWGNMINGARLEMAREPVVWWSLVGAFVFMFVLVLCANLFSDGMRDAFDPRTTIGSQR